LFQAHRGEAWALAVSPSGDYVISCGSDRVIRLYERTDEPLVLGDERETEREKEDDEEVEKAGETAVLGQGALNLPSKRTVGSDKAVRSHHSCLYFYFFLLLYLSYSSSYVFPFAAR